jgi:hypothetical protein
MIVSSPSGAPEPPSRLEFDIPESGLRSEPRRSTIAGNARRDAEPQDAARSRLAQALPAVRRRMPLPPLQHLHERCSVCGLQYLEEQGALFGYLFLIDRALFLFPLIVMIYFRLYVPGAAWFYASFVVFVFALFYTLPRQPRVFTSNYDHIWNAAGLLMSHTFTGEGIGGISARSCKVGSRTPALPLRSQEGTSMDSRAEARYWDAVGVSSQQRRGRHTLWRAHSDAVNGAWLQPRLPAHPIERLLKTDLFDEALTTGLYPFFSRAHSVFGVDISTSTLRAAGARNAHLHRTQADVRSLPFADGAFEESLEAQRCPTVSSMSRGLDPLPRSASVHF